MAALPYGFPDNISGDESEDESDFDDEFDKSLKAMSDNIAYRSNMAEMMTECLTDNGKRIVYGQLGLPKITGGIGRKTGDDLDTLIREGIMNENVSYETIKLSALNTFTNPDRYILKKQYSKWAAFLGMTANNRLYLSPPRSPKRSNQAVFTSDCSPGQLFSSDDPYDEYPLNSLQEDGNPDKVAEEFPDMDKDMNGPSSNLCPSCVTGLCDTHIQLRF